MDNKNEAAVDWSKPVETTCGKPARVICTDRKDDGFPIVALVEGVFGVEEAITRLDTNGQSALKTIRLRNKVEVTYKYRNVFYDGSLSVFENTSVEDANVVAPSTAVGVLKQEFRDGKLTGCWFIPRDNG